MWVEVSGRIQDQTLSWHVWAIKGLATQDQFWQACQGNLQVNIQGCLLRHCHSVQ